VISVSDTGPGIAERDHGRIFEEFARADGAEQVGGQGIGLAMSRILAHLVGGELSVESDQGFGSTFTLRLPWDPAARSSLDVGLTKEPPSAQATS
jgi:signal transduction histidine kinase